MNRDQITSALFGEEKMKESLTHSRADVDSLLELFPAPPPSTNKENLQTLGPRLMALAIMASITTMEMSLCHNPECGDHPEDRHFLPNALTATSLIHAVNFANLIEFLGVKFEGDAMKAKDMTELERRIDAVLRRRTQQGG